MDYLDTLKAYPDVLRALGKMVRLSTALGQAVVDFADALEAARVDEPPSTDTAAETPAPITPAEPPETSGEPASPPPPRKPPKKPARPAPAPAPAPTAPAPAPSREDLLHLLVRKRMESVKALFAEYGAVKFSDLPESSYTEVMEKAQALPDKASQPATEEEA